MASSRLQDRLSVAHRPSYTGNAAGLFDTIQEALLRFGQPSTLGLALDRQESPRLCEAHEIANPFMTKPNKSVFSVKRPVVVAPAISDFRVESQQLAYRFQDLGFAHVR
jgi:hypothetical protein